MTIQLQIMQALPQAKTLYFPNAYINGQHTGNQYLQVAKVENYPEPYQLWATVHTNVGEIIVTTADNESVNAMVQSFVDQGQNRTVMMYAGLHDIDTQHTDLMRLIQYGEARNTNKSPKQCIYYAMINGKDETIPF